MATHLEGGSVVFNNISDLFIVAQQKTTINYEKSQPSSIDHPVVDPNFNVMRKTDMNKPLAVILVSTILIIAVIAPLVAWRYFSK